MVLGLIDNVDGCVIVAVETDVHPLASVTNRLYEPGVRFWNIGLPVRVAPPLMLYCTGDVPPIETICIVPFANPLHVMFVVTPWLMTGPGAPATVVCMFVVQPLASVTMIPYAPWLNPVKLFDDWGSPLFSEYVYGLVPPWTVTAMEPLLFPHVERTLVDAEVSKVGWVMVDWDETVHPLLSDTMMVYVPGPKPL